MSKRYTIVHHDTGDIIIYLDGVVTDYEEIELPAIKTRREINGKVYTQFLRFKDGKLHCDNGPAISLYRGGYKDNHMYAFFDSAAQKAFENKYFEYWMNGVQYTKDEFEELNSMFFDIGK